MENKNPAFITLKQAGAVIGGEAKPVSVATVRRRFGHLIEHPTPGTSRIPAGTTDQRNCRRRGSK